MKIIKRLLLLLFAGVFIVTAALLFVAVNIDPNDYKEKIQAAAQQATGRKLTIEGNVGLTLFPALSLDLQGVSLDNPPGFEGRFASVERVRAKLDLLPLLQKHLEIGKVTLRKPRLNLHTLSDGRTNWKDLAGQDKKPPSETATGAGLAASSLIAGFSLAGTSVEEATVTWRDARANEDVQVSRLNLKTGALASGKPTEIALSGVVSDRRRGFSADLSLDAEVFVDLQNRHVRMDEFAAVADFRGNNEKPLNVRVNAAVAIDLAAERAEIRRLSANVADMHVNGDVDVAGLSDKARISLALKSDDLTPRALAEALDLPSDHWPERAKLDLDATIDLAKDSGRFRKAVVEVGDARVESEGVISGLLSENRRITATAKSNAFNPRALAEALGVPADHWPERAKLDLDATIDLAKDSGRFRKAVVEIGDARVESEGVISGLLSENRRITATVKSNAFNPRALAEALDVPSDHWPERAKLDLDATIDLAEDSGRFRKAIVEVGDARVESEGTISGLLSENRRITATVKSNAFNPRALAEAVGLKLPTTVDKQAFGKFAVSGDFAAAVAAEEASAVIRNAEMTLDDSRLRVSGEAAWVPALNASLNVELDRADAGRYFPPGEAKHAAVSLRVADLRAQIRASGQSLSASKVKAKVFDGSYNGAFSFDAGSGADGKQATWRSHGEATGFKIEQLLAALAVKDEKVLKGTGSLSYRLVARGESGESLTRSLAGSVELKLEKGAFKNPQLARNVEQVIAFFEKRPPVDAGEELLFHDVAASLSLKQGVADNRDLEARLPLLHLRGAGKADLVAQRIDYRLRVGLLRQPRDKRLYIPIKISGALDDPDYSVDLEKILREQARSRLRREAEKSKARLREKARDKLEDILKEGLKLPW